MPPHTCAYIGITDYMKTFSSTNFSLKSTWIPVCNLPQEFILTRGRGRGRERKEKGKGEGEGEGEGGGEGKGKAGQGKNMLLM